jgi:hypothetical protein
MDQLFQVVVKIGSLLCILQNDHVVEAVEFTPLVKG